MAKIYQFPNMQDKSHLEVKIADMQDGMRSMYDAIRKVEIGLDLLHKQCEDSEDVYQELIQKYAEIIGAENVAVEWLEFCNYVGMETDPATGKITVYFKPPEEEE